MKFNIQNLKPIATATGFFFCKEGGNITVEWKILKLIIMLLGAVVIFTFPIMLLLTNNDNKENQNKYFVIWSIGMFVEMFFILVAALYGI